MRVFRPLCIVVLSTTFISACKQESAAPTDPVIRPAKVITVGKDDKRLEKQFPGIVRAGQRVELAFRVSGTLVEFSVKDGQKVEAGQVIGKLDDRDYVSAVNAAGAEVNKNRANYSRAKELIVDNYISRTDFEKIKAAYEVSVSQLETAEKALADTQLVAPFSGSIARTLVENFQDVQALQAVVSLQDRSALELVINISESQVVRRTPQKVQLSYRALFDALPDQEFELYPKEFSTEANPETQAFEAVLGIRGEAQNNILPGMTATVVVRASGNINREKTITVPLSSIVAGADDKTSVWKLDAGNKVTLTEVTTGNLFGVDQVQIRNGLKIGDKVVTAGISAMSEGLEVNPISEVAY